MAKLLHDHLQQLLVGAKLGLQMMHNAAKDETLLPPIKNVLGLLDESIRESKSLTVELSPPILHDAGLVAAIKWLSRWMHEKHGLNVVVEFDNEIPPDADGICILLFEAVREMLFNVVKHAGIKDAIVSITQLDGMVQVVVSDQGVGFDPTVVKRGSGTDRFGMFSISQRLDLVGGCADFETAPGRGTRAIVTIPHCGL